MKLRPGWLRFVFSAGVLCGLLAAPLAYGEETSRADLDGQEAPAVEAAGLQEAEVESLALEEAEVEPPDVCEALEIRIGRLPKSIRRRVEGEDLEGWRTRMIAEVEVEAVLAAEAASLKLDETQDWQDRFARRRESLLLQAIEASFAAGIAVDPAEVEGRFEAEPERFRSPEKISTSFILLPLPADASQAAVEEARRRLLEIRAEHAAGERFGALARRYSSAENAARGGAVAASPRGELIAAYEEVAWSLSPGEVSEPFRLPAGMAIALLENVFPARELSLEEARSGIEQHLAWEKAQVRRASALDEARVRWPMIVDWPEGAAVPKEIRFGGEVLGLEDLGLANRPPRLRARLEDEIDRLRLLRLAEERGLAQRQPTAAALADARESMLVASSLRQRVESRVPQLDEAELRALYDRELRRFPDPERRKFEVHFLPGVEGSLRTVREEAERRAALWRDGSPPAGLETWGPLERSEIGGSTSPLLARIAFELAAGEVSEPVRLEGYRLETARFQTEGYVVLRALEIEPASTLAFEEVRDSIAAYLTREDRKIATRAVRAELAAGLDLTRARETFEDCPLDEPSGGRVRRGNPDASAVTESDG